MDMKEELRNSMGVMNYLGEETPNQMAAFKELSATINKDGAISSKTKTLIALAVAVKAQCSYCIALHVKKALDMGLTKDEMLEASWVAVLMGGGPSLMYVSQVKEAIEKFS